MSEKQIEMRTKIEKQWAWRDRHGNFTIPSAMSTRHLYHTLKMIWNNSMPEVAKIHPVLQYSFNGFYTSAYMKIACVKMLEELGKRKLNLEQLSGMRKMHQYINNRIDDTSEVETIKQRQLDQKDIFGRIHAKNK